MLYDFQKKAVRELNQKMREMQTGWRKGNGCYSSALVAPTGSGKTIICAAVIESLFKGYDDIEQEPGSVILWLTTNKLTKQTRKQFISKTDINDKDIVILEDSYLVSHDKFESHKVYIINREKFAKHSKMTNSTEGRMTIWDIIRETINDPFLKLYLLIDEAHWGIGDDSGDKKTIYAKLIDGQDGLNPAIPVVVGISATITRWNNAMEKRDRNILKSVSVSNKDVRDAGIVKETIDFVVPDKKKIISDIKSEDLYEACCQLHEFTNHWKQYCKISEEPVVVPLMVIQVEDKITDDTLYEICKEIKNFLPGLDISNAFANVFGEGKLRGKNGINIPFVNADEIQEKNEIRVLFAKDAISLGWDCPRAEVLYSRCKRESETYIHQILGRMVRTPLIHKIRTDDFLNKVSCYLPEYDEKSVNKIIDSMINDSGRGPVVTKVGIKCAWYSTFDRTDDNDNFPNVSKDEDSKIKKSFESIKSVFVERLEKNKLKRFFKVVNYLVRIGVIDDKVWMGNFERAIDDIIANYSGFNDLLDNIEYRSQNIIKYDFFEKKVEDGNESVKLAYFVNSKNDIALYNKISKRFVNKDYVDFYFNNKIDECGFTEVEVVKRLLTFVTCPEMMDKLLEWADIKVKEFIDEYVNNWSSLVKEKERLEWSQIVSNVQGMTVANLQVLSGTSVQELKNVKKEDGKEIYEDVDVYIKHVVTDKEGLAHIHLRDLEKNVVNKELKKESNVAWYRNVPSRTNSSLAIPIKNEDGEYKNFYPDFIFFEKNRDNEIVPNIIDPHGNWIGKSVPRLKAYIEYLKKYGNVFGKVILIGEKDKDYYSLNLKNPNVVKAIENFNETEAESLFVKFGQKYYFSE